MTQSGIAEIVPMEAQALVTQQDPEQLLTFAKRCADVLMRVYNQKKKKVVMNGRNYLEHEDWTVLARFFGVTARTKPGSVRPIEIGDAFGFECEAEAVKVIDGVPTVLSVADSMCLNDEENWGDRPKYDWVDVEKDGVKVMEDNPNKPGSKRVKREKKQVGTDPTPLFQLRSMAQTRAQAKVMRQMLSWVVVLSGMDDFSTTPAEEMTGGTIEGANNGDEKAAIKTPTKKEKPQGTPISEKQRKRLFAIARDAGFNAEDRIKQVIESHGFEHADEVTTSLYEVICKEATDATWKPAAAPPPAAEKPKAAAPKPTETIESQVQEVIGPKKDNKGDYVVLRCFGTDLYCRKVEIFPLLAASVGKPIKAIATKFEEGKYAVVSFLQIGDKEWMEDGLPVIRADKEPTTEAAPAQGVAVDFGKQE